MAPSTSGNSQGIYQSAAPIITSASNSSSTATMRRQNPPNIQQKQPDTVEAIPSSNSIDSAMYERDKQIYRCSTLRQGGKFDPKYKPSILNCPLPEIPKEAESPKKEPSKEQPTNNYSKTLQRPPMKLPPTGKAIPPPKIDTPTSPPQSNGTNGNTSSTLPQGGTNAQTKSPPPAAVMSPSKSLSNSHSVEQQQEQSSINPNDESNYAVTEL